MTSRKIAAAAAIHCALVVAIVASCDSGVVVERDRLVSVATTPTDGITGLLALRLDLTVRRDGMGLEPPDRDAIIAGSGLATWPDLDPVPSTITLTPSRTADPSSFVTPEVTPDVFTFTPQQDVPAGWYVALLAGLPNESLWVTSIDHFWAPNNLPGVRVHVGSAPALLGVEICPKSAPPFVVDAYFSEPVAMASDALVPPISVKAAGQDCSLVSVSPTKFRFGCATATVKDKFSVTVADGLISAAAVPVPAVQREIEVPRGYGISACWFYREPPHVP